MARHPLTSRPAGGILVLVTLLVPALPASAQDELDGARVIPGWVLTPTVALGVSYDDNPVLATHGSDRPDDTITHVQPGLNLGFTGKHTFLGLGYRGSLVRYRTLDEYDSFDQGARVEFRHQPTRRLSLSARNDFSISPTTDMVEVAGLPFSRTGTRQNTLNAGATFAMTKRLDLNGMYTFQWLEFDRSGEPVSALLQGGRSHGVTIGARQQLSSRLRVGADYNIQRATVGDRRLIDAGEEQFTIQNAEGVVSWDATPTVTLEGGFGISQLALPEPEGTRTGPAGRVTLRKRSEYALFSVGAMRSFVPGFGFGGSLRNQEVFANVHVPFARKRAYVQGDVAWRDSEPVLEPGLGVTALWVESAVGYAFYRWLRVEGFYNGAFQDTTVVGGRVDRNRVGVRVVTAQSMRLQ